MFTVEPLPAPEAFAPPAKIGHWSIPPRNEFFNIVALDDNDGSLFARTKQGLFLGHGVWECRSLPKSWMSACLLATGPERVVYVVRYRLYTSHDYGDSWTTLEGPFFFTEWSALAASRTMGTLYYAGVNRVSGLGLALVLRSTTDGGRTWDEARPVWHGKKWTPAPSHRLLLDGDETVFMATPGGVYRCSDEIVRLSHHTVLDAMAVSTVSPQIATAGRLVDGDDYHLQVSKDHGATWSTRDPYPYRFEVSDLLFAEELLFARVGHWDPAGGGKFAESILMTNDAADNWIDVTSPQLAAVLAAGDGEKWPRKMYREGLSYGHGRLFLPNVLPAGLYSVALWDLRPLAPDQ